MADTTFSRAYANLNTIIQQGRANAMKGLEELKREYDTRQDFLVKPSALTIDVTPEHDIRPVVEGTPLTLTAHSRSQLLQRAKVPSTFADTLLGSGLRALLKQNIETLLPAVSKEGVLVRKVGNTAKGILSSSYKRMDASPIFESYIESSIKMGFNPQSGLVSDSRVFLSFIGNELVKLPGDEYVAFGHEMRNSDYGHGALQLALTIWRAICINGAIGNDLFRKVHLGRRVSLDDFEGGAMVLSSKTVELDLRTVRSALTDVMKTIPTHVKALQESLEKKVQDEQLNVAAATALLKQRGFRKEIVERAKTLYEEQSLPVESVPEKPGAWRWSNVLSLMANTEKNQDVAADLRDVAFESLSLKAA